MILRLAFTVAAVAALTAPALAGGAGCKWSQTVASEISSPEPITTAEAPAPAPVKR